jgi:hypothetical protein
LDVVIATPLRVVFTDLAQQLGATDPISLGRQLHLVYDGAGLTARMDHGDPAIGRSARDAAQALLDAALPQAIRSRTSVLCNEAIDVTVIRHGSSRSR